MKILYGKMSRINVMNYYKKILQQT